MRRRVDTAVVLLDRRVVRVHKSGLCPERLPSASSRCSPSAAPRTTRSSRSTTRPGSEEVDIRQARSTGATPVADLQVLEATDCRDEDFSEPWYGLYYDNRAEVVRFEALRPGDVSRFSTWSTTSSSENQMADYFGDLQYIAETIPKRRWDYTLIAPAESTDLRQRPSAAAARTEDSTEGTTASTGSPPPNRQGRPEPAMPGHGGDGALPSPQHLRHLGRGGRRYWHLVEDQLRADDDSGGRARPGHTPWMSDEARVRAVYDFVVGTPATWASSSGSTATSPTR